MRTIVAPGYSASTAASTLLAVLPLSSSSSLRCGCDGSEPPPGWTGAIVLALPLSSLVVAESSAEALSEPASSPPASMPATGAAGLERHSGSYLAGTRRNPGRRLGATS